MDECEAGVLLETANASFIGVRTRYRGLPRSVVAQTLADPLADPLAVDEELGALREVLGAASSP